MRTVGFVGMVGFFFFWGYIVILKRREIVEKRASGRMLICKRVRESKNEYLRKGRIVF